MRRVVKRVAVVLVVVIAAFFALGFQYVKAVSMAEGRAS